VIELDRVWRERQGTPRESTAVLTDKMLTDTTSPHLLAKRKVRLARVEMKELRFRVTAPSVDEALADRIADALRAEMKGAYARGQARLADMHRTVKRRFDEEQARLSARAKGKPVKAPAAVPTMAPASPEPPRSP